jgi:hypothetical protein
MAQDWPTYQQAARMMSRAEPRVWTSGLNPEVCSARAGNK